MNELVKKGIEQLYHQFHSVLDKNIPVITTQKEKSIINQIKNETSNHNKNNLTRTDAYLRYYLDFPEVHWSFLAHMVSRNGGYNMTDLQNSLYKSFLNEHHKVTLFHFLERANALIFHDAYPQLLLFKRSKEDRTSYFHLLPAFQVSKFMIPVWEFFFKSENSMILTHALITNEQQYVENHLMSLKNTKESVFNTFTYLLQEKLGFTHVIFPYKRYPFLSKFSLAGLEIHDFDSVYSRINIGKKLYKILFSKHWYSSFLKFATNQNHSASRHDYWPHLFSTSADSIKKIYSPTLLNVWNDVPHQFQINNDWFKNITQIQHFHKELNIDFQDITKDVKRDLKVIKTLSNMKDFII